jgi:hypothetical protein
MNDPRDALMLGRTFKTTGINVLRADPAKGKDWWVCRCQSVKLLAPMFKINRTELERIDKKFHTFDKLVCLKPLFPIGKIWQQNCSKSQ